MRINPKGIREAWLPTSTSRFNSSWNTRSAAAVKQGELQYQESRILIPALREAKFRKASDRSQLPHFTVMAFNPAAQDGAVTERVWIITLTCQSSPLHRPRL
jgi:hypothetical protein